MLVCFFAFISGRILKSLWHITKQFVKNKAFLSVDSLPFARKCLILQAKFSIMIDKIRIGNYKSIVDLTLDLGRFNVIIGTNGCGKSNILEAITMGALGVSDNADIAHNPYVLDGLDLSDDEQRLFVVATLMVIQG